ncbi:MAG: DUF4194 domain-containing protein [Candidatus Obscuribacter phosphatis]|uniref:DUF4194 domain-containing protein n=1 Tax=Candidatus Obscuribacter phosphatis TaxID=1906157 RepID=A0A8J7PBX0_9BACT|nr:DUF4194 domain-containing protein [Candidatus Obscuribacter phosphatis]
MDNDASDLSQMDCNSYSLGNEDQPEGANALFFGDTGALPLDTRRTMMHLLAGPFVSGKKHSKLWTALIRDERIIKSRLSEFFLDIVIDREQQVAFVKQFDSQGVEVPTLLRRSQLTFVDSVLILHLRRRLTAADAHGERAVVSESELIDHLSVYERAASTDRAGFIKRVKASVEKCKKNNILQLIRGSKDRFEVSPTLKLLFSAEEIVSLTKLYSDIAAAEGQPRQKCHIKQSEADYGAELGEEDDD